MSSRPLTASLPKVRRRRVFYVMGFDPRGVKFYYLLLKWEAKERASRGDCRIRVGPLQSAWAHGQHCLCRLDCGDGPVEVDYEILSTTDIVSAYFQVNPLWRLARGLHASLHLLLSGLFFQLLRCTWPFALFSAFPLVALALGTFISLGLGVLLGEACLAQWGSAWLAALARLAPLGLFVYALDRWDRRLFVLYLLGDFRFTFEAMRDRQPVLQGRIQAFADRVVEALADPGWDEVVVIGHSSGTMLACHLVAEVLGRLPELAAGRLGLVTLGGQHNVALYPGSHRLRAAMTALAEAPALLWIDVFAPQDPINAGRFDPVERLGLRPRVRHNPHLVSARFPSALRPDTYRRIRFSFFRLHMQFLMANETGEGFDFFRMIGSPLPLGVEYVGILPRRTGTGGEA
jgi:hypothetical protein